MRLIQAIKLFLTTYKGYALLAIISMILIHFFFPAPTSLKSISLPQTLAPCFAKEVIDGDSLIIRCNSTNTPLEIRLAHIDAPEWNQNPWGDQAKQLLKQLVINQPLTVQFKTIDIYQRYIAIIHNQKFTLSVNEILLKKGMAISYANYKPPKHYLKLVSQSKKQHLGIWQTPGLHQDPKKYRRLTAD